MTYIDKGIDAGRVADRDYMEYMGNPDKSTGVFTKDGILDSKDRKELREVLRNAKGNIWDLVISLDGELGKERLYEYGQAYSLLNDVLPRLFKRMGFDKDNIIWYAGLHTNTDNRHVHVSFFEIEPTFYNQAKKEYCFRKGRVSNNTINLLKADVESHLFSNKEELKALRKDTLEALRLDAIDINSNNFDPFLRSEFRNVAESIPRKGKHSYSSIGDDSRKHIDNITYVLLRNSPKGRELMEFLENQRVKEKEYRKRYKVQRGEYKTDIIYEDIYRRIGNKVINRIITERNKENTELDAIRSDNLRRKIEIKKMDAIVSRLANLAREEQYQIDMEAEVLKRQAELEILMEKGLIDENGNPIEMELE